MAYIGKTPASAALTSGDISDGIITSAKIANGGVETVDIADANVTAAKLASGTVQNQSAFKNIIINGDMSVAQRSTSTSSITTDGFYSCDRWKLDIGSFGTWTQSQDSDVPSGYGFSKSLKMDCTTAQGSPGSSNAITYDYSVEGQNLQYLKWGTSSAEQVTLSFWHKHTKTGLNIVELLDSDNADAVSGSYTQSVSNTWEKATIVYPAKTSGALDNDNARSLRIRITIAAGSNYTSGTLATTWQSSITNANRLAGQVNNADSTSNNFIITGVQLEAGTSASDFEVLPFDINLLRCQRYFFQFLAQKYMYAINSGNTYSRYTVSFPVQMRTTPTTTVAYSNNGTGHGVQFENANDVTLFVNGRGSSETQINSGSFVAEI